MRPGDLYGLQSQEHALPVAGALVSKRPSPCLPIGSSTALEPTATASKKRRAPTNMVCTASVSVRPPHGRAQRIHLVFEGVMTDAVTASDHPKLCAIGESELTLAYSVVRWRAGRPRLAMRCCMRRASNSWPFTPPAARVIDSFIRVPPRSLAPAFRQNAAPCGPIFTHDVWILAMYGCSTSRAMACIITASRKVGPDRAMPFRHNGASMCTKGKGTNSVKPPVSCWRARICNRWRAQCLG